jgi:hypothetical protein
LIRGVEFCSPTHHEFSAFIVVNSNFHFRGILSRLKPRAVWAAHEARRFFLYSGPESQTAVTTLIYVSTCLCQSTPVWWYSAPRDCHKNNSVFRFSVVRRCVHFLPPAHRINTETQEEVAIKVLHLETIKDEIENIQKEISLQAKLDAQYVRLPIVFKSPHRKFTIKYVFLNSENLTQFCLGCQILWIVPERF